MTPGAAFLARLIGVRPGGKPTISDGSSAQSTAIARHMLGALGLATTLAPEAQTAGALMERLVAEDLRRDLGVLAPERRWLVDHSGRKLSRFSQYEHLDVLQRIIEKDETGVLGMAIGREYEVAPDVTVGLLLGDPGEGGEALPVLHASISCKLTIRSDRVQNIRQESAILTRQRRGRLPHVVAVTIEPLPSRIASIARGTGDVDAVYHPALAELQAAVDEVGSAGQKDVLDELVGQRRLLDYSALAETLVAV